MTDVEKQEIQIERLLAIYCGDYVSNMTNSENRYVERYRTAKARCRAFLEGRRYRQGLKCKITDVFTATKGEEINTLHFTGLRVRDYANEIVTILNEYNESILPDTDMYSISDSKLLFKFKMPQNGYIKILHSPFMRGCTLPD